ncbi:MAG: hypothetical protein ACF8NJ_03380 [Phycisphaerales bacterium JB038]
MNANHFAMRTRAVLALSLLSCACSGASATTYHVYPGMSIQGHINIAAPGDEIIVYPGRYEELINFLGKAITVRGSDPGDWDVVSATILDGDGDGPIVTCASGEGSGTVLSGLTITNGDALNDSGGMVIGYNCAPTVSACWFLDNRSDSSGGAIGIDDGGITATNCVFSFNEVSYGLGSSNGGAVSIWEGWASFSNCTFMNNTCDGDGGAIWHFYQGSSGGQLSLTACTFSGNTSDEGAGAVSAFRGSLVATDCVFYDNHGSDGGGLSHYGYSDLTRCQFNYNSGVEGGGAHVGGPASLADCSVEGNTAGVGGGLYRHDGLQWSTQATVSGCTFTSNVANAGGGLYLTHLNAHATFTPTITGCTFISNAAAVYQGGGICNEDGKPRLIDCDFHSNTAVQGGGGLCNVSMDLSMSSVLLNCDFRSNVAEYGGGIYNYNTQPGVLTNTTSITNCGFIYNWGLFAAGGVFNFNGANATITNSTFTANVGYNHGYYNGGGGIVNTDSAAVVNNSILWGDVGGEIWNLGVGSCAIRYSDIQGGYGGTGNINADPSFVNAIGPDGVWGTLDDDVRLAAGSPCIDAADCTALPADAYDLDGDGDTTEPLPVDLDGLPRVVDDPNTIDTGVGSPCVDMGAHEFLIPCAADLDGDGDTDQADLGVLLAAYGNDAGGDLDGDGDTDQADLGILLADYGCTP